MSCMFKATQVWGDIVFLMISLFAELIYRSYLISHLVEEQ